MKAMRGVFALVMAVVAAGALAAALRLHLPWETLATAGLVLLCLGWLIAVLTLPWNLYFHAKEVLFDMQRAKERGMTVRPDREAEAKRVQQRMLRLSLGLHIGSALLAAGATAATGGRWGYLFSVAYLASSFFRPGVEYYRYLRQRLGALAKEVTYPREDVIALRNEVRRLREEFDAAKESATKLREHVEEGRKQAERRDRELEKRFVSLSRTFEETVNRLTDNQQIIGGIKAMLRLIQQGGEAEVAAPPE